MSKISVAIATFNRSHILPETLGYIYAQKYPPSQVVVIDDGSSDGTEAVLKSYKGKITWKKIANSGAGAALKAAIELCQEEWIAICDDDDKWHSDHLSRRVDLIKRYPDVDFTFSNFSSFGPNAIKGFDEFTHMPKSWWRDFAVPDVDGYQLLGRDLFQKFLIYNPVFPTSVCLKKSLYDKCGGIDPKFSRLGCWDAHFTWRCVLHGTTACDRKVTVETRRHGGNFSKRRSKVNFERAEMLESAWHDGWVPERYALQVEKAIDDSKITASWWAWNDKDYEFLQRVAHSITPTAMPLKLKARVLLSYLPMVNWLRK